MENFTHGNGSTRLNNGNFLALPDRFCINLRIMSSHRIIRPIINATGIAGNPISKTSGSEFSIICNPSLCPITCKHTNVWLYCTCVCVCVWVWCKIPCKTVTAPYVTAVQYSDPTMTLAARNGLNLFTIVSIPSSTPINVPIAGNTIMYSVWHCGQLTRRNEFPFCFSSTHRCKHCWWTHLAVPLHLHGCTWIGWWLERDSDRYTIESTKFEGILSDLPIPPIRRHRL